ncbi:hypothetical protein [Pseudoduganella sp.]|uniref:hypothetical protein n=1 Tax=Pseudoduganella sp. TaxID=1880898 RepID=UPI0035B006D7
MSEPHVALHNFSPTFWVTKTVAETQTLQQAHVYNGWLGIVVQQARFPRDAPQKKLDFRGNLVLK